MRSEFGLNVVYANFGTRSRLTGVAGGRDFKTHISTSTMIGMGYGALGLWQFQLSWPVCMVAGGLCSGCILPDADSVIRDKRSEKSRVCRRRLAAVAARSFEELGVLHQSMLLAGGCLYIIIWFGLGELLRRITVHRGMWHSLPAAIIAGLATSLVCSCEDNRVRFLQSQRGDVRLRDASGAG
ncbi:MAG: metal-dependent hydrolase [Pirellulaceae bacterium]